MSYPCPYCNSPASPQTGCPGCGRGPDADASEVVRLDAEIADLTAKLAYARQVVRDLPPLIDGAWVRRNAAASRVRAARAQTGASAPGAEFRQPPAPASSFGSQTSVVGRLPAPAQTRGPEASTKLVQNALFLLGGLLLAVAAVVFTAVAWAQFGVGGRAALLAFFTGAALAVPPVALRRKLSATAETFAAVGLLLVLLDGYAAWYVDLFGLADGSPWGYAGAVCAVTAAVAAGYEHVTGLTGPRFAALVVAQPVVPLLAVPAHPGAAGWALVFAAVGALDVAVLALRPTRFQIGGVGVAAYLGGAASVGIAGCCALAGLAGAESAATAASAGGALLTAVLVVLVAAVLARNPVAQAVAGGLAVVALDVAGIGVALRLGSGSGLLRVAIVTVVVTAVAVAARRLLPPIVARGPRAGTLVVITVPVLAALALVAEAAASTLDAAGPFLGAGWGTRVPYAGWPLLVSILLLAVASIIALPASRRGEVVLGTAVLTALALPAGLHLRWWSAPIFDLVVVAGVLAAAIRSVAPAATVAPGRPAASPPSAPVTGGGPTVPTTASVATTRMASPPASEPVDDPAAAPATDDPPTVAATADAATTQTGSPAATTQTGSPAATTQTGSPAATTQTGSPAAATQTGSPAAATQTGSPAAATLTGSPAATTLTGSPAATTLTGSPAAATDRVLTAAYTASENVLFGPAFFFGAQILAVLGLVGHAVTAGFGRAGVAAGVLGAVTALGFATAAFADAHPRRRDLGGAGLLIGLLAVPAVAWTTMAALTSSATLQSRIVLAAVALTVAGRWIIARTVPGYRPFALAAVLLAVVTAPAWALASGDSPAGYAAVALLLLAFTVPDAAGAGAASPAGLVDNGQADPARPGSRRSHPAANEDQADPVMRKSRRSHLVVEADRAAAVGSGRSHLLAEADQADLLGSRRPHLSAEAGRADVLGSRGPHLSAEGDQADPVLPGLRRSRSSATGELRAGATGAELGWTAVTAVPLGSALVVATGRSLFRVFVEPYHWLGLIWAGRPVGVPLVPVADAVALLLVGIAAALVGYLLPRGSGAVRRRAAAWTSVPVLAVALPVGLVAARAPWPVVPGVELAVGLTGLLVAALRRSPTAVPLVGALLAGPGLAGALPTHGSTLAALGAVLIVAAVAGRSGRTEPIRVTAGLLAVATAFGLAATVGDALELRLRVVAFLVLGAAAVAFAASWLLSGSVRRPMLRISSGTPLQQRGGDHVREGRAVDTPLQQRGGDHVREGRAVETPLQQRGGDHVREGRAVETPLQQRGGDHVWEGRAVETPIQRRGGGRVLEGRAVEAAAHAGAVLALLLTVGSIRYTAAVCILWGVALGIRALGERQSTDRPAGDAAPAGAGEPAAQVTERGDRGTGSVARHRYVVAAAVAEFAGWCLLMAAANVSTVEVYTVPAAGVALLAGLLARRHRPSLSSWTAYGPALAAALLPSLATIAGVGDQYPRRLLLGLAALAIVVAGANARLQAPVVLGGGTLTLVALHELAQAWDLIPRWIPLAAGGLLLVLLAMTLERRRRDLDRLRDALTRMT